MCLRGDIKYAIRGYGCGANSRREADLTEDPFLLPGRSVPEVPSARPDIHLAVGHKG